MEPRRRSHPRARPSERGEAPAAKVGLFVAILAILTILPLLLGTVISEVLGR